MGLQAQFNDIDCLTKNTSTRYKTENESNGQYRERWNLNKKYNKLCSEENEKLIIEQMGDRSEVIKSTFSLIRHMTNRHEYKSNEDNYEENLTKNSNKIVNVLEKIENLNEKFLLRQNLKGKNVTPTSFTSLDDTLKLYRKLYNEMNNIPAQVTELSSVYEFSKVYKVGPRNDNNNFTRFQQRYKEGINYKQGEFNIWCGYDPNEVKYIEAEISNEKIKDFTDISKDPIDNKVKEQEENQENITIRKRKTDVTNKRKLKDGNNSKQRKKRKPQTSSDSDSS